MSDFIANTLEIVKGRYSDYKKLKEYHYIQTDPVCVRDIYKVRPISRFTWGHPDPIAVIVYMVPIREWAARNIATNNYFSHYKKLSVRYSAINRNVTYLARIIVDPRYHRKGIASWLLTETLKLQTKPLIETMTPIDRVLPLFKKAGFKLYYQLTPERYTRCREALHKIAIIDELFLQPEIVQNRIESVNHHKRAFINKELKRFVKSFHHHENMKPGLDLTKFVLSKLDYPNAYLLWRNPNSLLPPLPAS